MGLITLEDMKIVMSLFLFVVEATPWALFFFGLGRNWFFVWKKSLVVQYKHKNVKENKNLTIMTRNTLVFDISMSLYNFRIFV